MTKKTCTKLWEIFRVAFLVTILVFPNSSLAEESLICSKEYDKKPLAYIHPARGKVVVYTTPPSYTPLPEDLVCAVIEQFWKNREVFPEKFTVMVVRADYMNALIMQVNTRTNTMMIAPIDIPTFSKPPEVTTVWTIFPDPMKRITEMIRLETLPLASIEGVKANYIKVSQQSLIKIALPSTFKRDRTTILRNK